MDGCPRCGAKVDPEDLFCGKCGMNIFAHQHTPGVTLQELRLGDVQLSLGIIYFKKAEYKKAIEIFGKVLKDNANHLQAKRLLNQAKKALLRQAKIVS
jgi:tetratricopeptide (TPR) repeat protein